MERRAGLIRLIGMSVTLSEKKRKLLEKTASKLDAVIRVFRERLYDAEVERARLYRTAVEKIDQEQIRKIRGKIAQ